MKKIAFITPNYTGATLPLAKQFIKLGWKVDYYLLFGIEPADGSHPKEAMILRNFHAQKGLHKIESKYFQELYDYMGSDDFQLFYYRTSRPYKSVPIWRYFVKIWRFFEFKHIIKHLKEENYDLINLVGNFDYDDFLFFHKNLNARIITSFHEVCNHWQPDFNKPSPLLSYLFKNKKEIVVHSKNSYNDIVKYKQSIADKINHINFGIFETFKTLKGCIDFHLPEKYILFFGAIKPYKGLSYLLEAINIDPDCLNDYKLVIAGGGFDAAVDEFKKMKNVTVINRYIKNEELIYLVEHCKFVVCPYTTMSQSGLPQTIFAFNKPIIASDLDGFKEVVIDNKTGLLFKTRDAKDLSRAIKNLASDDLLYSSMVNNIGDFENINELYSWSYIVRQYVNLYQKNIYD